MMETKYTSMDNVIDFMINHNFTDVEVIAPQLRSKEIIRIIKEKDVRYPNKSTIKKGEISESATLNLELSRIEELIMYLVFQVEEMKGTIVNPNFLYMFSHMEEIKNIISLRDSMVDTLLERKNIEEVLGGIDESIETVKEASSEASSRISKSKRSKKANQNRINGRIDKLSKLLGTGEYNNRLKLLRLGQEKEEIAIETLTTEKELEKGEIDKVEVGKRIKALTKEKKAIEGKIKEEKGKEYSSKESDEEIIREIDFLKEQINPNNDKLIGE